MEIVVKRKLLWMKQGGRPQSKPLEPRGLDNSNKVFFLVPQASLEADLKTGFKALRGIEIRTSHVEAGLEADLEV